MKKLLLSFLCLCAMVTLSPVAQASGCGSYGTSYSYGRTVYRPSYSYNSYNSYSPSYDYVPTYERTVYQPFYFLHGYAIQTPAQAFIQLPGYAVGAAPVVQAPSLQQAPAPQQTAPAPNPQPMAPAPQQPAPAPNPQPRTAEAPRSEGPTNADVIAAIKQLDSNTQGIYNDLQEIKKRVKKLEGGMPPAEKE